MDDVTSEPLGDPQMRMVAVVVITYDTRRSSRRTSSVFTQRYDDLTHLIVSDECSNHRSQDVIAQRVSRVRGNIVVHLVFEPRTSAVTRISRTPGRWQTCSASAPEIGAREDLAAEWNPPIVLDSAPAFGSPYADEECVGGRGAYQIFSIHATKSFVADEGGQPTPRHREHLLADRVAADLRQYGP